MQRLFYIMLIVCLFSLNVCHLAHASTHLQATGIIVIDKDTVYQNTEIDLNNGSFLIKNDAILKLVNCQIKGNISPKNPALFVLKQGTLLLEKNKLTAHAVNINPNPRSGSLFHAIKIELGNAILLNNEFSIDQSYSVGMLTTGAIATGRFEISSNSFVNFHGGIYLLNNADSKVIHNTFNRVSSSNIFSFKSKNILIKHNSMLFAGNNDVGDAIDVVYSKQIEILNNYIAFGSCYSIVLLRSDDVKIHDNQILGGITYAIYIHKKLALDSGDIIDLSQLMQREDGDDPITQANKDISIENNFIDQNRYGLTAHHVNGLIVKNNIFIQRFADALARRKWTNNDILLSDTTDLTWKNNLYREAFSQAINGDNSKSFQFTAFPEKGGVILPLQS